MNPKIRCGRIIATLLAGAFFSSLYGCGHSVATPQVGAPAVAAPVKVSSISPQRKSLLRVVEQPGTVLAHEETQLFARVPGYVKRVHVDLGQDVHGPKRDSLGKEIEPGQLLAEIAVPELEEETNQKKALVRLADAEVEQSRKLLSAAEANIAMMEAMVVEAKALYGRWESESKRIGKMVASGTIDPQAHDETLHQFKAAAAHVLSAEAAVLKAKADRDKAIADVGASAAHVDVMKADSSRSLAMLGYA